MKHLTAALRATPRTRKGSRPREPLPVLIIGCGSPCLLSSIMVDHHLPFRTRMTSAAPPLHPEQNVLLFCCWAEPNGRDAEMRRFARVMLVGVAALAAAPAGAEVMSFRADLKGSSEVPPNTSPGTGTYSDRHV